MARRPDRRLLPDEKLGQLAAAFDLAGVPHAFGGAIALLYWSEPGGTVDIVVNIFLPASAYDRVGRALEQVGVRTTAESEREAAAREQVRFDWDGTPVDLFFAYDPFHDACSARAVQVDFYGSSIRVLSAEDIVLFKALYARPKDWADIEQLLAVQGDALDARYVSEWISRMLPGSDPARLRLEALLDRHR